MSVVDAEREAVRAIGREHRPARVELSPDALVCACGYASTEPDGLEDHRAGLILAALVPFREAEKRQAAAEALLAAADGINARASSHVLIELADKHAGYYQGIRSTMQAEEQRLRARAAEGGGSNE